MQSIPWPLHRFRTPSSTMDQGLPNDPSPEANHRDVPLRGVAEHAEALRPLMPASPSARISQNDHATATTCGAQVVTITAIARGNWVSRHRLHVSRADPEPRRSLQSHRAGFEISARTRRITKVRSLVTLGTFTLISVAGFWAGLLRSADISPPGASWGCK